MTTTEPTVAFTSIRKGYDPDEVDAHIRYLHGQLHDKDVEVRALAAEMEQRLQEAKQREEAVHLMLVAATKTKDEMAEAARQQLEEAGTEARGHADKILSEARYEAFRLVTEARAEADVVLESAQNQSNEVVSAAKDEAQAILSTARREALEILTTAQGDATNLVEASDNEKERLRDQLEAEHVELAARVERLRSIAHELETRLQRLASSALGDLDGLLAEAADVAADSDVTLEAVESATEEIAPESDSAPVIAPSADTPTAGSAPFAGGGMPLIEPAIPVQRQAASEASPTPVSADAVSEPPIEVTPETEAVPMSPAADEAVPMSPAIDEAPPVDTTLDHVDEGRSLSDRIIEEESSQARAGKPRGSFYSRRSAKLPRIGDEAGKGALAAVSAMRERLNDDGDDNEDLAMRTA